MLLTDGEIIKRLSIGPTDRVLDIGGSMMQHSLVKVDTLADIIRPEEALYGSSKLLARHFVKIDITREKLPFKDKEFDVCLCTHTLEDLPTPFPVMDEMSRVAKRGLIVTPSMGEDMKFTPVDFTDWNSGARRVPGQAHHKWFFVKVGDRLQVIPKNYPILYTKEFQVVRWTGEKEMEYYWRSKINYSEFPGLSIHNLIDEYARFINKNRNNLKTGAAVIFIDNPFNITKALVKRFLKRGSGYKYRSEKIY